MRKALRFARLDFITVQPYLSLKNLAIFMAAPLILVASTGGQSAAGAAGMVVIFAALYVSYPFVISEKNGMDTLYAVLAIDRKTVVLGRYLFATGLNLCAMILGLAFSLAVPAVTRAAFGLAEALLTPLILFAVVCLIEAVQLPLYFKLGYEKAKLLAYLPFVAFWLAVLALSRLDLSGATGGLAAFAAAHPYPSAALGLALWLGALALSCRLSIGFYGKREF